MLTITDKPIFDLTVTIHAILTICAIVAPILTTLLNNHHQYKMKKLELTSSQKFEVIERYLSAAGKYLSHDSPPNFIAYGEAKGIVYLYIPKSSWKAVDELGKLISSGSAAKAYEFFPEVCKELSKSVND